MRRGHFPVIRLGAPLKFIGVLLGILRRQRLPFFPGQLPLLEDGLISVISLPCPFFLAGQLRLIAGDQRLCLFLLCSGPLLRRPGTISGLFRLRFSVYGFRAGIFGIFLRRVFPGIQRFFQ